MAIRRLLARLGFVQLRRYGLVLTPDDRILSTRSAVLDDGLGGKIVGWDDGDLAAMELQHWSPNGTAKPAALPAMPPPVPRAAKLTAPVALVAPVQVAPPPPTEDDEWEWEIAVAKARATAMDAEPTVRAAESYRPPAAARPLASDVELTARAPESYQRHLILPAQRSSHVVTKPPARMPSATERQPLPLRAAPTPPAAAMTVLSKPELEPTRVRPVVTLRAPVEPVAPRKFDMAKTEPSAIAPEPEPVRGTVQAPIPKTPRPTTKHEETIRTLAAPPAVANDDRTDTAIALPPAPAAPHSSSPRRVAARQR